MASFPHCPIVATSPVAIALWGLASKLRATNSGCPSITYVWMPGPSHAGSNPHAAMVTGIHTQGALLGNPSTLPHCGNYPHGPCGHCTLGHWLPITSVWMLGPCLVPAICIYSLFQWPLSRGCQDPVWLQLMIN